jgi:hypothetical protein
MAEGADGGIRFLVDGAEARDDQFQRGFGGNGQLLGKFWKSEGKVHEVSPFLCYGTTNAGWKTSGPLVIFAERRWPGSERRQPPDSTFVPDSRQDYWYPVVS